MTNFTFDQSPPEEELSMLELADQLHDIYGFTRQYADAIAPVLDKHMEIAMNACSNVIKELEQLPGMVNESEASKAKMSSISGALICTALSLWLETDNRLAISKGVLKLGILHTHLKGQ